MKLFPTPEAASFRCTGCGACCAEVWVNVTDADVQRLCDATGLSAPEVVQFVPPTIVEGEPEDDGWIPFGEDARDAGLMTLKISRETGACRFLSGERCTVYAHRPRACRLYPWDVVPSDDGPQVIIEVVTDPCPWEPDGTLDTEALLLELEADIVEREEYEDKIHAWVDSDATDDPIAFLKFLGLPMRHSALGTTPEYRRATARRSRLESFFKILR